jgi:GH35 family endo-1,4-beta-xylanase
LSAQRRILLRVGVAAITCAVLTALVFPSGLLPWKISAARNLSRNSTYPLGELPLRTHAQSVGFYVGAAVNMSPFRNEPQYTSTLKQEFNVIVAENAFKFDATHPAPSSYNFNDADALVNFAEANGMKIRGHTLVWYNQLPSWVTSCNCTRDQAIQIMSDHIHTLVGRYRGRIWAWDVVNEGIDDSTGGLRTNSFWYQKIGPDYIDMAFRFAREADPNALLYYNDYSIEGTGTKSNAVYNLMNTLKSNGAPIDAVGWQGHFVNPFRVSQAHHVNAQRLAALGLQVSITELDVRIQSPTTPDKLNQQALAYRDLIDLSLSEPNINALVMWGFTDKYSWIPGAFAGYGDALIFDTSYQPKPSYNALLDGLKAAASLDNPRFYVRQQYLDFLGREPDPSGLVFWTNEITSCGPNQTCLELKRINVSAAYFLSIEFQQTGYLVERMYKAAYGDASGGSTLNGTHSLPVPIVRFNEFLPDTQKIGQGVVVGQTGWETVLENNKQAFASEFTQRSRFADSFAPSLTPPQFVDTLFLKAGVTPSVTERNDAINEFGTATNTSDLAARARALRRVAESPTLATNEFNRAFVLMQYFGYLRRDPNGGQDTDYTGYDFWLTKLNQFNGNFVSAEMVKAFITSAEYRQRFGP